MKVAFSNDGELKKHLDKMRRNAKKVSGRVGIMGGSLYPDGTNTAFVGITMNYGTIETNLIPARPFFTTWIQKTSPGWGKFMLAAIKSTNGDVVKMAHLFGESAADGIKKSIRNEQWEDNAESTIARKGFNAPLRDTGHLINSITYEIQVT